MRPLNSRQEDTFPGASGASTVQRHPIPMPSLENRRESLYSGYFLAPPKKYDTCPGPAGTAQRSFPLLTHKNWSSQATGLEMINLKGTFMSLWFIGTGGTYILPFRVDLKSTARNFSDAPIFHCGHSEKYAVAPGNTSSSLQPYHQCPVYGL